MHILYICLGWGLILVLMLQGFTACYLSFFLYRKVMHLKFSVYFFLRDFDFVSFFYNIGLVHNFLGKSSYQDTWHDKIYHLTKMHLLNKDTKYHNYNIPYLHWSTFWGKRSKADDITKIHSNTSKRLRVYHFSIF